MTKKNFKWHIHPMVKFACELFLAGVILLCLGIALAVVIAYFMILIC